MNCLYKDGTKPASTVAVTVLVTDNQQCWLFSLSDLNTALSKLLDHLMIVSMKTKVQHVPATTTIVFQEML